MRKTYQTASLLILLILLSGALHGNSRLVRTALQRLNNKCSSPKITGSVRRILTKAEENKLLVKRFISKINEGLLKNISCPNILSALQKEYSIQNQALLLLEKNNIETRDCFPTITGFLHLGLKAPEIAALLEVYSQMPDEALPHLAAAGNFLIYMKDYDWPPELTRPLGKLILKKRIKAKTVKALKRLLLSTKNLRLDKNEAVAIIVNEYRKGKSLRQIRLVLREKAPF